MSNYAFSQNGLFGKDGAFSDKWHKGKLVLKSKDTLVGFVKFDDASKDLTGFSLSNKVKFRATENGKKQKFKKKKVDYFVVTNNSGKTHKYTYLKVKVEGYKLLKIEAEGKLNLYTDEYAYWSNETPNYKSGTTAYVKKPDEKKINYLFFGNAFSSFKKRSKSYFSDCPSLVTKIENGIYKLNDFRQIVKEYNNCDK